MGAASDFMRGYLVHLSFNMWADRKAPEWKLDHISAKPYLRFDDGLWDELIDKMVEAGLNTVVIDVGDGIQYRSHPEIAVEGAWSADRLRTELARLRAAGLEPLPKLNFSACHDTWLGPYARMLSTEPYYQVCGDLIDEVIELFDKPRLFHLGMDEETARHQRHYAYVTIRQHELWWHDVGFFVDRVARAGVRPWVWSDYVWDRPDLFYERMPRSVLQSNWYYGADFGPDVGYANAYLELEARGYDQVPTGSNWSDAGNMQGTVGFCRAHIAPERLLGFLQTVWRPTLASCRDRHLDAIARAGQAFGQHHG